MKLNSFQIQKIKDTIQFQFCNYKINVNLSNIQVTISRKTKRIKSISINNKLSFSIRPTDGRFLPTVYGIKSINYCKISFKIIIHNEAIPFLKKGKSIFNKYIIKADEAISPGSEIMIFNMEKELLGVGIALQPGYGMIELNSGIGAKVKNTILIT